MIFPSFSCADKTSVRCQAASHTLRHCRCLRTEGDTRRRASGGHRVGREFQMWSSLPRSPLYTPFDFRHVRQKFSPGVAPDPMLVTHLPSAFGRFGSEGGSCQPFGAGPKHAKEQGCGVTGEKLRVEGGSDGRDAATGHGLPSATRSQERQGRVLPNIQSGDGPPTCCLPRSDLHRFLLSSATQFAVVGDSTPGDSPSGTQRCVDGGWRWVTQPASVRAGI